MAHPCFVLPTFNIITLKKRENQWKTKKWHIYKCLYWICITNWNKVFSFGVLFLLCFCSQTFMISTRISTQCIIRTFFSKCKLKRRGQRKKWHFLKTRYCIVKKTTVLTLLVQLEKNHKSFMSKLKLFSNSSIIPQSCCPGNWIGD